MITTARIYAGDKGRIDYYLARAAGDEYPRGLEERGEAISRYYSGRPADPAANRPGRWVGRGADALGLTDLEASPEQFRAAVTEAYLDGAARAKPELRTPAGGRVAAEPFAAAVRQLLDERGISAADLFASGRAAQEWATLARAADRFDTTTAATVAKLGRAAGIDPAGLYGVDEWASALAMAHRRVDTRLAATDVVMTVDKSVSLLYATADEATRRVIVAEFHEAARSALGYLDTLAATGRRGSSSGGTGQEEPTEGLVAVGFLHDEARPTGDCACGDMHLHEHVIVMNTAQGVDGKWSAIQHERLERNEKTAGHLLQAELRARLSDRLGIAWRPVVNGVAGVAGITDAQRRHFSKRSDDVTAEQVEAGTVGKVVDGAAGRKTRQAKREQLPIAERIAYWQAEAAAVGLTPDVVAAALDRPAPAGPATDREGDAYAAGVLERLTAQAASFHRSDLLRTLADDCRQGESIATLTGRADAILSSARVVALGEGEGGLTTRDVRRGRGGRVLAYAIEQKWTTPEQLALEQALVDAAVRRAGAGCARLDGDLVEEVIGRQPFVLSDEQAAAVRVLTTSGAGVDVLHASAGTGKTRAVLGSVRQAYEAAGYRVVGAATSAKAARVLADDGGLQASTIARLLLDLERPQGGGIGPNTVLVLDEASMIGTRDLAALLQHAEQARAKVLVVGDTRQLAAVDAGGGLRALQDRLGAATLTVNRRQHAEWESTALADVAAGTPAEALRAYTAHERVTVSDTALSARAAMVAAWWGDVQEHGIDRTLMAAVRNVDRTELNHLARGVMRKAGRLGDDELHAAGRTFAAGDRVMLLRNSAAKRLDNGDTGTVAALDDGRLVVGLDRGTTVTLDRAYLAAGQVEHAYAATVYKAQGSTVTTGHVLGTGLGREDGYVALSRGRAANRLYLVEGQAPGDPELDLPDQQARGAYEQAVKTLGSSRAKRLALDSAAWGADADQLAADLQETARLLRQRPASDTARLPALHAEVTRLQAQIGDAGQRLDGMRAQHDQLRRRDPQRQVLADRIDRQTGALGRLQTQLAGVRATVAAAELGTSPRHAWEAAHTDPLERAVSAGRELGWRARAEQRAVQAVEPAAVTVAPPPVTVEAPSRVLRR